jgi:hypothetical protein
MTAKLRISENKTKVFNLFLSNESNFAEFYSAKVHTFFEILAKKGVQLRNKDYLTADPDWDSVNGYTF